MADKYIPTGPAIGERLVIVCGPPRAGKNTYVDGKRQADDVVLDLDEIMAQKGDGMSLSEAYRRRNLTLRELARRPAGGVWLIIGAPRADQREAMRDGLKPGRIVVLETPIEVCEARDRDGHLGTAIGRWWADYTTDERDEIVRD